MKKWNLPKIEELNISETANGKWRFLPELHVSANFGCAEFDITTPGVGCPSSEDPGCKGDDLPSSPADSLS